MNIISHKAKLTPFTYVINDVGIYMSFFLVAFELDFFFTSQEEPLLYVLSSLTSSKLILFSNLSIDLYDF